MEELQQENERLKAENYRLKCGLSFITQLGMTKTQQRLVAMAALSGMDMLNGELVAELLDQRWQQEVA